MRAGFVLLLLQPPQFYYGKTLFRNNHALYCLLPQYTSPVISTALFLSYRSMTILRCQSAKTNFEPCLLEWSLLLLLGQNELAIARVVHKLLAGTFAVRTLYLETYDALRQFITQPDLRIASSARTAEPKFWSGA